MATIDEFAEMTRSVIVAGEFDEFMPTVLFPESARIMALSGVPDDADVEAVSVEWAAEKAVGEEEFLVAFRISQTQFKVVRRFAGGEDNRVFNIVGDA